MTNRRDVSLLHNNWTDAQRVDKSDMDLEQDRSIGTEAAGIQNHFGSGVLLESPIQNIIFDSDTLTAAQTSILAAGNFDGQGLDPHAQPTDSSLGNQLEVELTGSSGVVGRFSTKVAIIGVAFDDSLIVDRFYFHKNEKQVTANHYKTVLAVFFNDFKGNNNCSRALGGRVIIRQAASFQLSRDPIMVAHDVEPDIFWRDWKVADAALSLYTTIQNGIGASYSVDALNINTTERNNRLLEANDVVKRVGQKFQATTDNIQKVTLLLGVQQNDAAADDEIFDWTGDLVVSVYALQTTTGCPTDIVPGLAIEFDPASEPISQVSFDQAALEELGYVLTNVPQPVDFVFSSTKLGSGATSGITPGNFYAVTIGRSGAATAGTLFLPAGNDNLEDSRLTVFTGVWTDVVEEDLWFQIWTDAAKIADGRGYDNGIGMQYDKTATDPDTGGTIDNQITDQSFVDTGESNLNIGVLQASEELSVTEQDERTGNNVFSRKQFVPEFTFYSESGLAELRQNTDPIVIGCAEDINPKDNPDLTKTQTLPGLAKGDQFIVVNPDADLLSLNMVGSKLIPNTTCVQENYLIAKVELCTDGYGDVNGDGVIDSSDIARASALIGESITSSATQQKIVDGYVTTLELLRADVDGDGTVTAADVDLITQFVNKQITTFPAGATFTHLIFTVQNTVGRYDGYFDCDGYIRLDGYTGQNIVSPDSLTAAQQKFYGNYSTPSIDGADPAWNTIPFANVTFEVRAQPYWQPQYVIFNSDARVVPSAFCELTGTLPDIECDASPTTEFTCADRTDITPICDPGTNTFYVHGDLVIGRGQIRRPDGNLFRGDYEVATVILELPEQALEEVSLNMFDKLVADRGDGLTMAGYPAMRYADCTTVQDEDLSLGRVRFSVSVQAFVPNLDGYNEADGYGVIVDDIIGVYVDQTTGILSLSIKDLYADQVLKTLVTKIQIDVLLKKSGWVNTPLTVSPAELPGLLS